MASNIEAPAGSPAAPREDDYQALCAALTASARGRAFLAEYARRHRGAETETLLAAMARLEALVRTQADTGAAHADALRGEMRVLAGTIRAARPELNAAALPARAARLAVLLDLVERRLQALAEPITATADPAEAASLAVVPPPDEPELPIPTPAAARLPGFALAQRELAGSRPASVPTDAPAAQEPISRTAVATPVEGSAPPERFAALLALSEEERLALFT